MAILFKFPRNRGSYCFFQKILARRMLKDDVNSSFPVVFRRVLNYALGYCVVDVFYSGRRGEVEIHFHFQRFRLLKDSDQCPGSAILRLSSLYAAPNLWNNLPREITSLDSLSSFKCHLKTYLFKQAFSL